MAIISEDRISRLTEMTSAELTTVIRSKTEAEKWSVPVDYSKGTGNTDYGTVQIPLSRIGLLTANRMVPQAYLPNQVATILLGNMTDGTNGTKIFTYTSSGQQLSYAAPDTTQGTQGTPPLDTIFVDNDPATDYIQYRFVGKDQATVEEAGWFVPIPSDLVMVDGIGTTVTDDRTAYTRKIDLVLDTPKSGTASNGIGISGGKLVHYTSPVTANSYPAAQSVFGFGGTVNVLTADVNNTGHVTNAGTRTVTVPNTAATSTSDVKGLVKIGVLSDIQPIASSANASAGTTVAPANGYVKVAAADHKHSAATLTLSNNNVSGGTSYNGSSTVTYDFENVLKCALPSNAPSSNKDVLSFNGTSAVWTNIENILTPRFSRVTPNGNTYDVQKANDELKFVVSGSSITLSGVQDGHVYHVSYCISCTASAASNYMYTATVSMSNPSVSCDHLLNGSYSSAELFCSGSFTFIGGNSGVPSFTVAVNTTGVTGAPTWTCLFKSLEVAEVK